MLIDKAHSLGLQVHPYTFQNDFLGVFEDSESELRLWINKGVDGIFTEFVLSTYELIQKLVYQKYQCED